MAMDSVIVECQQWLENLELHPKNSSLLLEAVKSAVSSLRKLLSTIEEPSSSTLPPCLHVKQLAVAEGEVKQKRGEELECEGSTSFWNQGLEGSGWQEDARIAANGGAGKHMAALVGGKLSIPACAALVNFIETCLLLSLDENGEAWLHKWLAILLSPSYREQTSPVPPRDDARLDWLVAYLSVADSHLFLEAFIDQIASELVECRMEKPVAFLPLVRQAMILDYVSLKVGELAAMSFLSALPITWSCFPEKKKTYDYPVSCSTCCASICLIMGFVCPDFFGTCARLLVPKLSLESSKSFGNLFRDVHCGEIIFDAFTEMFNIIEVEPPKNKKMCLYAFFVKRLPCLHPVAADTVSLLNQLSVSSADPMNKDTVAVVHLLLEMITKELYQLVLLHKSGLQSFHKDSPASLFLENLQNNLFRLWDEATCHSSEVLLQYLRPVAPLSSKQCILLQSSEMDTRIKNLYERKGMSAIKSCIYEDLFTQICILTILSCNEAVVANILANSTTLTYSGISESDTFARLFMVVNIMELFAVKNGTQAVYNHWAKKLSESVLIMSDEEALSRVLALKKILDLSAALSCNMFTAEQEVQQVDNLSCSYQNLKHALECQWPELLLLLQREAAWDLKLAVLAILQLLLPDGSSYCKTISFKLKRLLGLFFFMLDGYPFDCNIEVEHRWKLVQLIEQLKCLIIHHARSSYSGFALMMNSLLDYSFQEAYHPSATINACSGTTYPAFSSAKQRDMVFGKLNRHGRLEAVSRHDLKTRDIEYHKESRGMNWSRMKNTSDEHDGVSVHKPNCAGGGGFKQNLLGKSMESLANHLWDLLYRTCQATLKIWRHIGVAWPSTPISLLVTLLLDHLRTPHDIAISAEQYEQVLPKHISTPRHVFLIDCFRRNPFLFKVLSIIVGKGGHSELLSSMELVRALLADSISSWYSSYQFHRLGTIGDSKVNTHEVEDRVHVFELVQLISSAGLLPEPLASSSQIVSLIDSADIADLLLLVWQCMHHTLTFGQEIWKLYGNTLAIGKASTAIKDCGDIGITLVDWQEQYFTILRKNVASIGPHFSHLYPKQMEF